MIGMCSKEETAEVIHNEFYRDGGLRDSMVEEIDQAIDARVGRWLIGGGVVLLFAMAAAWFSLSNEVSNNSEDLENVLTSDQAALIIQRVESLSAKQEETNESVKALDERLRSKGL